MTNSDDNARLITPARADNDFGVSPGTMNVISSATGNQHVQLKYLHTLFLAPEARTRQQAYRWAAWLVAMADMLPDEEIPSEFAEVLKAIRNS